MIEATALLLGFCGLLFVGSAIIPGRKIETLRPDGTTFVYRLNGLSLFLLTTALMIAAHYFGWFSLSILVTHFLELFIVTNIFAFAVSGWLYMNGRQSQAGPVGFLRDYYYGVTLNPTLCGVDLKIYSYRPSLIGLALMNASFAVVQYETYGSLTLAMILYQGFTFLYVLNYFQFENGMVFTWDIVSEKFGWMLVWGDFVLVPFFYCICGWYLVHAPDMLSPLAATLLVMLYVLGFWMFRGTNSQKHRFKSNPNIRIWGRPAQALDGRLLVSGFWGFGRHMNYTGEILVYFSFFLTTCFVSWVPLLLPLWLTVLLIHRSWRDEQRCHAKYGELWERYKQRVRYTMFPPIY
ncbi:MAG: DUF1295 domain-containing protein [Gammaproteobacteria bacterium]|nr:DUF1295 domain-containing protein [Gammaproteobacteria bacterium]